MLGADAFALSGTVKDNKGAAIVGALVSLVSDTSLRQTTNANGEYTLAKPVSILGEEAPVATAWTAIRPSIQGGRLHFSIPASVRSGSLAFYTSDGNLRLRLPLGPLEPGDHQLRLPELATGIYVLRLGLESFSGTAHLVHTGTGSFLMRPAAGAKRAPGLPRMAAIAAAVDTLLVKKSGFVSAKTPIESYDQTGLAIVLRPDSSAVSPLPPITDYSALGPFATVVEANVGPGGSYTIFRPEPLGKDGFLHAPIIYGHGIGGQVGGAASFLKNIASH
jgi:hypothetical protein